MTFFFFFALQLFFSKVPPLFPDSGSAPEQVQKEPIVCESTTDDSTSETLITDLRVRGVWEPQIDRGVAKGGQGEAFAPPSP